MLYLKQYGRHYTHRDSFSVGKITKRSVTPLDVILLQYNISNVGMPTSV